VTLGRLGQDWCVANDDAQVSAEALSSSPAGKDSSIDLTDQLPQFLMFFTLQSHTVAVNAHSRRAVLFLVFPAPAPPATSAPS
jgi:hypothetical protein